MRFSSLTIVFASLACAPASWQAETVQFDSGIESTDSDGDGWSVEEDCDDDTEDVHPGAIEICDGMDNNCDGLIDEDVGNTWYQDSDSDGYGDPEASTVACEMPEGYVPTANDCDDSDSNSWPGAPERCDGLDNDCDGEIDESLTDTWYADTDGDGFGNAQSTSNQCDPGDGWVENSEDCSDADDEIFPDAEEVCDLVDNDCDGEIDEGVRETWYADADSDGYGALDSTAESCTEPAGYTSNSTDCDDTSASINPAALEVCDALDNDCDGTTDEDDALDVEDFYLDADGDGYATSDFSVSQCDCPSSYLSVVPGDDFDCNDSDEAIHPDAYEVCDGQDNDCDGDTDDDDSSVTDPSTWYLDYDGDGYGTDTLVMEACDAPSGFVETSDDCDDTAADVMPDPSGDCALGTTCLNIYENSREDGDGNYTIDPDGWDTDLPPFDVYCEMDGDDPGWTEIAYSADLNFDQHFSVGNTWQSLPDDFDLDLSDAQIDAIRDQSTEGKQKYEGRCEGVIHHYHKSRGSYSVAFGFVFHDGSLTAYGAEDYSPHDIEVKEDGCKSNGGEAGSSHQATWFKIADTALPVVNIILYDGGDSGEEFGSPLLDNSAWLR